MNCKSLIGFLAGLTLFSLCNSSFAVAQTNVDKLPDGNHFFYAVSPEDPNGYGLLFFRKTGTTLTGLLAVSAEGTALGSCFEGKASGSQLSILTLADNSSGEWNFTQSPDTTPVDISKVGYEPLSTTEMVDTTEFEECVRAFESR